MLVALGSGAALVAAYSAVVSGTRYPYLSDSASYLEMAGSITAGQWPAVVPWGLEIPNQPTMGQVLFPPGLPLLVALASPFAGGLKAALLLLPRVSAALLPVVLLLAFRGALADSVLVAIGVAVLFTRGVGYWHYVGYSDLPGLLVAVVALGLTWQAAARGDRRRAVWAGACAGLCYVTRNAGLAVIAAGTVFWTIEWWRERSPRGMLVGWLAGLLPVYALLKLYYLVVLGSVSPYTMPASTHGLLLNVADWVAGQLGDLELWPGDAGPPATVVALTVVAVLGGVLASAALVGRATPAGRLGSLLAAYVACGGALTVYSRTVYEWGGLIDDRHALQYTFALLLLGAVLVDARGGRWRQLLPAGAAVLAALLGVAAVDRTAGERREPEMLTRLAADPLLLSAVRELPAEEWIASNQAAFLRIETGRAVRQSDFGGNDEEFVEHLAEMARRVKPRPVTLVLVCDRWTVALGVCGAAVADPSCRLIRAAAPRAALCRPPSTGIRPDA